MSWSGLLVRSMCALAVGCIVSLPTVYSAGPDSDTAEDAEGKAPPCTIGGVVLDVEGEPVAGIEVIHLDRLTSSATAHTTKTDRNGRFLFVDVPSSPCHLLARPSAEAPPWRLKTLDPAKFRRHELANLDCRLAPAASITVIVKDKAGAPVAGARVTFIRHIDLFVDRFDVTDALCYTTATDAEGRAAVVAERAGHIIVVAKQGFATLEEYENPSVDRSTRGFGGFTGGFGGFGDGFGGFGDGFGGFGRGSESERTPGVVEVVLQPASTVTGLVLDSEGRPVPGAEVTCLWYDGVVATARTGRDGTFTMDDVAGGEYILVAKAEHVGTGFVPQLRMPPGKTVGPITVSLKPHIVVEGRVIDTAGEPVEDAEVNLHARTPFWMAIGGVTSSADGTFRIDEVPDEDLYATAGKQGCVTENRHFTAADGPLEFVLSRKPKLTGVVTSARSGRPVRAATVLIFESSWSTRAVLTDHSGRFAADVFDARGVYVLAFTDELCTPTPLRTELEPDKTVDMEIELHPARSVSGVVVEADGGRPIPDATVCFDLDDDKVGHMRMGLTVPKLIPASDDLGEETDGPEEPLFSAVTGPDGAFRIPFLIDAHETVTIEAGGYVNGSYSVPDLDLTRPLRFELEHGLTVKGRVLSTKGEPIERAVVRCSAVRDDPSGWGEMMSAREWAQTDDDGRFEVTGLAPGSYEIEVTHDRFISATIEELELQRGAPLDELAFTLAPGAFISGEITDEDGLPVHAVISIAAEGADKDEADPHWRRSSSGFGGSWQSESGLGGIESRDGRYTSKPLPAGRYTVTASAREHEKPEPQIVELAEGETREGVNFVLPRRTGQVSGVVVDEDGNPVKGASLRVRLTGDNFDNYQHEETDDEGSFTLTHTGNARVRLEVEGGDYMTKVHRVKSPATGLVIVLERLPESANLTLAGLVIDKTTGEPITEYELSYDSQSETGSSFDAWTSDEYPDGRFEHKHLKAGTYTATVKANGYVPCTISDIQLAVGQPLEELLFALDTGATIAFTITSEVDGRPVAGAKVVREGSHYGDSLESTADGVCRAGGLGPGTHTFLISHESFCTQEVSVEVKPGDQDVAVDVVLGAGITLRGRIVVAGTLEPIEGASVSLERTWDGTFWSADDESRARTDAGGAFVIERLRPGSFDFMVSHDSYVGHEQELEVGDPPPVELVIKLSGGGTVAGIVTRPDGTPVPGVEVSVAYQEADTGEDGRYQIDHVPPGKHYAIAVCRGAEAAQVPSRASATVVEGQTVQLDFVVGAGVTLSGAVTRGSEPLPEVYLTLRHSTGDPVWTRTGNDGRYRIECIPPGQCTLNIRLRQGDHDDDAMFHRRIEIGTEDVVYDIELGAGRLSGVVRGADGAPVDRAMVTIEPAGKAPDRARVVMSTEPGADASHELTDIKGRFNFSSLSPGKHTVITGANGHARYTTIVDIPESGAAAPLDIRLKPEAALVLHISTSDGQLPGNVFIVAYDEHGRRFGWRRPSVDADTRQCRYGGLGAGRHFIYVRTYDYAPRFMTVNTAPGVDTPVNIQLRPGRTLSVAVVDASGARVKGARIGLDCEGPIALVRALNDYTPREWIEAPDGTRALSHKQLPSGAYTVRVRCDGYEDAALPVTIAGRDEELTVTLKRRSE